MNEPVYQREFTVTNSESDCFGRLRTSALLYWLQELAGTHFDRLRGTEPSLEALGLMWVVVRHRVAVERLPRLGETVLAETWPMPATRTAYPRAMCLRDADGRVLVKAVSLWALMDRSSRALVLPGKSGVAVPGTLRGGELELPRSLAPCREAGKAERTVTYSLLDTNGHMNNTRYLDWAEDLLSSAFHRDCSLRELTVCYLSEALEGQQVHLSYSLSQEGVFTVDGHRERTDDRPGKDRVFGLQALYE